jgi:hypothetical protein
VWVRINEVLPGSGALRHLLGPRLDCVLLRWGGVLGNAEEDLPHPDFLLR